MAKAASKASTGTRKTAKSSTPRKPTTASATRKATSRTTASKTTAKTNRTTEKAPVVVKEVSPVVSAPPMKKPDLVDAVVERSGIKKRDAKPAIEAALAILGETLAEGRELNMRPFGKVKVQRSKEVSNGTVMMLKLRQPKPQDDQKSSAGEGVADAAE